MSIFFVILVVIMVTPIIYLIAGFIWLGDQFRKALDHCRKRRNAL